jgi:hypothetical protein
VASCSTLNVTVLVFSAIIVAFSDTMARPNLHQTTRRIWFVCSRRSCEHLLELIHRGLRDQNLLV